MATKTTRKQPFNEARLREDTDNYINSVFAALALINELRFDSANKMLKTSTQHCVGRRMLTSNRNAVQAATEVTPDVVLQDGDMAVVGEITTSLANTESGWQEKLQQLRKYDDDLTGWWTENERLGVKHDITCLVQSTRAVMVSDILRDAKRERKSALRFRRRISVVGFDRSSGATKEFMSLTKHFGDIATPDISERLRKIVKVPFDLLLREYGERKFVDFEPPQEYLLQVMWENLFSSYAAESQYDEIRKYIPLRVTAAKVTRDLQNAYGFASKGNRSPEVPKQKWVGRALRALVILKLAHPVSADEFEIRYKSFRKDALVRFGELLSKNRSKLQLSDSKQPSLFPDNPDTQAAV